MGGLAQFSEFGEGEFRASFVHGQKEERVAGCAAKLAYSSVISE